ncbi:putative leucine-rich repeat domain superfamily, F-box-like domain superfamily [Arabidopsis thaliana]
MDRISLLLDDVVFKILSLVPTKDVVSTNILSKRRRYLWKQVPKLEFLDTSSDTEH